MNKLWVVTVVLALMLGPMQVRAQAPLFQVVAVSDVPTASRQWIESVVALTQKTLEASSFTNPGGPKSMIWLYLDTDKEKFFQEVIRNGVVTWTIDEVRQRFARVEILTSSLTMTVYVRADSESVKPGTRYFLAKEATRLLGQYAFSGKDGIRAFIWLREGHSELYAAKVIEAGGGTSYAQNRKDAVDNLRRFLASGPISLIELETPEQFRNAQNTRRLRAYGLAWLAYEFLEQRYGHDKVKDYFKSFQAGTDRSNFGRVFGINPEEFSKLFDEHLKTLQ